MWAVTDRFLNAIPIGHHVATALTLTQTDGTMTPLTFAGGSVTVDRTQRIRRTANLAIRGGSAVFDAVSTPGAKVGIDHGILYGGADNELVPMIRGELSTAALQLGDGLIQIGVADRWQGLTMAEYLTPYTPATTATRVSMIVAAVNDVYPGITVRNNASDSGLVGTQQAWTSRSDMVNSLATDGGMDVFFAPDGALVLKDLPKISDPIAWTIKTGPLGTLEQLTRTRALDKVYNAVVLTPATADAAQQWTSVTAEITDTNNPRHKSRLGRVAPYRYQSPTALTTAAATTIAGLLLTKIQGSTETLALGALANPALEGGDIVRILTPIDGGNTIVNHFLDSAQVDLVTGSMTCATRANSDLG